MNHTRPTIAFLVGGEKEHEDDARQVARCVQEAGAVCLVHEARDVVSAFDPTGAAFTVKGEELQPDLLVGYVCKSALLPTMPILLAMERRGFRILNTAATLQTCQNKFLTSEALLRLGIPHFPTLGGFGQVPLEGTLPEWMSRYPLVNKPETGSGGRQNLLLKTRGELDLATGLEVNAGLRWFLQAYMEKPVQRDIRVVCFGYKPTFAYFRYAPLGGWVTNLAVGGRSERIAEISGRLGEVAAAASRAVGAQISGVDLVEDPDVGYRVFEVNSLPSLDMDRYIPNPGPPLYPVLARFLIDIAANCSEGFSTVD
jgi:RimK family alpha-L-glutamate ligase